MFLQITSNVISYQHGNMDMDNSELIDGTTATMRASMLRAFR